MTGKRQNRRDLIIETAAELFQEQGYDATSVRQIAAAVGCSEAALYYHFKEGKRELLQRVVEIHAPDLTALAEACRDATSLADLVARFGDPLRGFNPPPVQKLRWLAAEFPNLSLEDRVLIQDKQLAFHQAIAQSLVRFVDSQAKANALAWLLFALYVGYGQLFNTFDLQSRVDFSKDELIGTVSKLVEMLE